MIKATLAVLAVSLMAPPAIAGPLERLIEMYAAERVCGTVYASEEANSLVKRLEERGMTFNEIKSIVVQRGKSRAAEIEVSGDKLWICRAAR